jgi:DNA polymerase-3 subunit delta
MTKPSSYKEIMASIKKKAFAPIYILQGEEEFFIDQLAEAFENHALDEADKAFNMSIVYGADLDGGRLRDMASRLPMMAPRQVIIVREAQSMRGLADLVPYMDQPPPSTLLVLCHKHKKFDKRSSFWKSLKGDVVLFESDKLKDYKVSDWITDWVQQQGFEIQPEAVALTIDYVGVQLNLLTNQLSKLLLSKPKGSTITLADIQEGVGISRDFNVFELQKALGEGNTKRVVFIAQQMAKDIKNNHPVMVLGSLHGYFVKIYTMVQTTGANDKELAQAMGVNPYFLKEYKQAARHFPKPRLEQIFGILHDFDLRTKGIHTRRWKYEDLLIELVHHLLRA